MNLCFISKYIFFKSVAKIKLTLTFWIQQNAAKKNLGFKNLLAEICHFNTPKYKNQFSKKKSTGS